MSTAISLPFQFDDTGSIATTADSAKIWQDRVIMVVMTDLGERVMRPTYGSDTPKAMNETVTDALSLIRQSVTVAFSRWLTDLTLIDVIGSIDKTDGYLVIQIRYKYRTTNNEQSVTIKTAVFNRSGDTLLEVANGR